MFNLEARRGFRVSPKKFNSRGFKTMASHIYFFCKFWLAQFSKKLDFEVIRMNSMYSKESTIFLN